MPSETLSTRLSRSVSEDFFRPLARPSAPVYVDCADRLIDEAGEAGRLSQRETIEIIKEVIARHPLSLLAEDEGAALRDARMRANQFFNRLIAAGWLEDQTLGLHERWAVITPGLRPLLRMLRDLAEDRVAELKTFADTLRGLCQTLEERGVLDPLIQPPDQLRSTITDLTQRLERAIEQLHAVEKIVTGFEQRQRQTATAADTLNLLYEDFSKGQHMVCYDALRRGGLLTRIENARSAVSECHDDPLMRERLASGLREHYGYDDADAYDHAVAMLTRLERDLGGLKRRAEAIVLRMAAFNRLSQQRYRYQTELRGRRPEIVKAYCDAINAAHAGGRFSEFASQSADFAPRCVETRVLFGSESLYKPRRTKSPVDLRFGETGVSKQSEDDVRRVEGASAPRAHTAACRRSRGEAFAHQRPHDEHRGHHPRNHRRPARSARRRGLRARACARRQTRPLERGRPRRRRNGLEPHILERDEIAGHRVERFAITREG